MSRKRGRDGSVAVVAAGAMELDGAALDTLPADDQQQQQQQQQLSSAAAKRQQQRAGGELQPAEVAAWVSTLSRHFPACSPDSLQAFAELHLLCAAHWPSVSASSLTGYHSFTIKPRAELFATYCALKGMRDVQAAGTSESHPRTLQLVRFLLEVAAAPYAHASLTIQTVKLPPFLVSWASRWGWASSTIELIVLQAYAPVDPCSSSHAARRCAVQWFVPVLPA